jgi:signal transduction histidine kinase
MDVHFNIAETNLESPGTLTSQGGETSRKILENILAFDTFQREIRSVTGKEQMLNLALGYLNMLSPMEAAGFFLFDANDPYFSLHSRLTEAAATRLRQLVNEAVESGVFGWAVKHQRPAVFQGRDGITFLILNALRSRVRVQGMFAGICTSQFRSGRNGELLMMNSCLSCTADVIEAEELRLRLEDHNRNLDSLVRQRTAELETATHRLEDAQQLAKVGSLDFDLASKKTVWSENLGKILQITSLPCEPEIGALMSQFAPTEAAIILKELSDLIATGTEVKFELKQNLPNTQALHLLARFHATEINDGKVSRIFGTFQDITEQKQTENQLRTAKEAAEAADRTKSAFLATISHELRTPLNAIMGYTQILNQDASVSEVQREQIAVIQSSAEHLLELINDLLDISKAEAVLMEIHPKAFDLVPFLQSVENLIRRRVQEKNIGFTREVDSQVPIRVYTDPRRLRQVLLNLLGNAIRFTDKGGIKLKVTRVEERIRFSVEDSGCGISAESLNEIFLPFHQVGEVAKREGGTGLGLAISRCILKAMGTDIAVQSQIGQGTRFWFELKMAAGTESAVMETVTTSEIQAIAREQTQPKAIPSAECLGGLYRLALSGKVADLQRDLEKLASEMPEFKPFADSLLPLVASFKMKAVRELIKPLLTP